MPGADPDGWYGLPVVSSTDPLHTKDDVVNVLLSPSDLQKLRNEITAADMPHLRTDPPHDFGALNGWGVHEPILPDQSAAFAWDSSDWLAYNLEVKKGDRTSKITQKQRSCPLSFT